MENIEYAEDQNSYLKVLDKAFVFLIRFVRGNQVNQNILLEFLDTCAEFIEYGVHSWELIAEICKDNEILTQNSSKVNTYIRRAKSKMETLSAETQQWVHYLSHFNHFMSYQGNPIPEI